MLLSASPFPLTLSLLSACLASALTIPSPDGALNSLEPFKPNVTNSLSGIDPKRYEVPGTEVWVGILDEGNALDQDAVLDLIDTTYSSLSQKPPGSTMNADRVRVYIEQPSRGGYYIEVYRIFAPQTVEWEWIADALTGLRTIMTLPADQGGIGVRSIEFVGGHGGYGFRWRGWVGVGKPPRPPLDATQQTVAKT